MKRRSGARNTPRHDPQGVTQVSTRIITPSPKVRILGRPPVSTQAPTPRKQADGSYFVDSSTSTLVSYRVRNREHGWECSCIAAAYRRTCRHLMAVLTLEAAYQAPELADDFAAIAEFLEEVPHATRVRLAQEGWRWDDGEA